MSGVHFSARDAQIIRDTVGIGLSEIKRAFELAKTDEFAGDVILAVGYLHANGLAVHVRGVDRHSWNLSRGADHARRLRERMPELAERFPAAASAPGP